MQGELFGFEVLQRAGTEGGIVRQVECVEGVVQQPLGEGEAVTAGKTLRPVERPREKLLEKGEDGRAGRGGHRRADCFTLRDVASIENLMRAAHRARRGKSRKPEVEDFFHRVESDFSIRSTTGSPKGCASERMRATRMTS